jgi:lipid A 3-O-deacylase
MPRLFSGCGAALAAALLYAPVQAMAGGDYDTWSLQHENDIFFHTDRDYTSGQAVGWTSKPQSGLAQWIADFERDLPVYADDAQKKDANQEEVRIAASLGQYIYTSSDISQVNPPLDDHPYGGFLFASAGLLVKTCHPHGTVDSFWTPQTRLEQFNIQIGVTGSPSLAEEAQNWIHRIKPGNTEARGWHTQIGTEPGLVITYERAWRYEEELGSGFSFQMDPHVGGAVGNIFTYANTGGMLRLGYNVPDDFGPVRLNPNLPGASYFEKKTEDDWGWYIFAGVDNRLVVRNIFLDGNTWMHSRHVDKNPFVTDLQYGAAVTILGVRVTYTHIYRTQEFKTQRGADRFGAINISFRT